VIRDYRQEIKLTSGLNHNVAELSHPWHLVHFFLKSQRKNK